MSKRCWLWQFISYLADILSVGFMLKEFSICTPVSFGNGSELDVEVKVGLGVRAWNQQIYEPEKDKRELGLEMRESWKWWLHSSELQGCYCFFRSLLDLTTSTSKFDMVLSTLQMPRKRRECSFWVFFFLADKIKASEISNCVLNNQCKVKNKHRPVKVGLNCSILMPELCFLAVICNFVISTFSL